MLNQLIKEGSIMNKLLGLSGVVLVVILILTKNTCSRGESKKMMSNIKNISDIIELYPSTPQVLEKRVVAAIADAQKRIDAIIAIPDTERTFANTAQALDTLESRSNLSVVAPIAEFVTMVDPEESMRNAGQKALIEIVKFATDKINNNPVLFKAFKAYVEGNAKNEELSDEQQYYLQEQMKGFRRSGLHLPKEQLEEVKQIKNELMRLGLEFEKNIAIDARTITVARDELEGLSDDFIDSLKTAEDGKYILGLDYPTYFMVTDHCDVAATRKKLYQVFQNRGYPVNKEILEKIISLRDKLAKMLGFESFADLDIGSEMAKDPSTVRKFLDDLLEKVNVKESKEFALFTKDLPKSVALSPEGKFYPWDVRYIFERYKKKHFAIDETKIAEYFPMEKTVDGLLSIYQQFLGLTFKQVPISGLWHEDVSLIEVHDKLSDKLIGYLLFDLYPRPNKYSHACQGGIVSAIKSNSGEVNPALAIIVANFPKSTANKPSLLKRDEVETFFHEFGHAMHSLLGRTNLGSFSGTSVKTDFVEVPSQMFEEWMRDKDILKKISSHYKTGESLPDELLDKIIAAKKLSKGWWTQRQIFLARLALDYFEGSQKDLDTIMRSLHDQICLHQLFDSDDHRYASFGHLVGYGAKYYSYLWSLVYAIDLFSEIKKHGLLNQDIGKRYVDTILGKGGSKDPQELMIEFLGREPNQENFLKEMGFTD